MSQADAFSPTPPRRVWASGDLSSYASAEGLERHLEAIDVRSGIYEAFDATGRLLRLEVRERGKQRSFFPMSRERVAVSLAEEEPSHREELREILVGYLEAMGDASDVVSRLSFEELVSAASQRSNVPDRPAWWLRR